MKDWILILSAIILLLSAVPYVIDILKGKITPRPLSWLGWILLMGTSLVSQIIEKGFNFNMSIVIGSLASCTIILILSLLKKRFVIKNSDWICFGLGIACLIIYLSTKDALITTVFAILADFSVGLPTIQNAYANPRSESLLAWGIGTAGTSLSFLSVLLLDDMLLMLFPIYLFGFNLMMFLLCLRRLNLLTKNKLII